MLDYFKTHKPQALIVSWLIISIVAIITAVAFIHDSQEIAGDGNSMVDEEESGIVEIPDYTFMMTNRSALTEALSNTASAVIFDNLEAVVMNQDERRAAPQENTGGESDSGIPNSRFIGTVWEVNREFNPNDASGSSAVVSFILEVSDGRRYNVNVLTSEVADYVATLIRRDSASQPWLFINRHMDADDTDAEIIDWVRSLNVSPDNLQIEHSIVTLD